MDKMFRPSSRRRTDGIKFEFRFNFHASRVPNSAWDKLVVSLIPVETGKPTVKTSKGHVRNGTCQWPDPIIESTRITHDPSTREYDEKMYRLLVSMGSLRSGILGEATINLSDFINTDSPDTVALPLRNCNAGTVLHVKIQCLTPRTSSRELERRRGTSLDQEDLGSLSDENDTGSDLSENLTSGSVGSSASQPLSGQQYMQNSSGQMKPKRAVSPSRFHRDGPSSLATSRVSSDSLDSITHANNGIGKNFSATDVASPTSSANGLPRRHSSGASRDSSGMDRASNGQDSNRSSYSQNPKNQGGVGYPSKGWQDQYSRQAERMNIAVAPGWGAPAPENGTRGSSGLPQKLEAAEETIQELRQESTSWERHARKLSVEVETLKQQLATQMKHGAEHGMEMSALEAERDSLKLEVEQLKAAKMASKERETGEDHARWEAEDSKRMIKELQEEVAYEKEVNLNLNLQLHKTQDSYADFVSAITELEETIEQQSREIERLTEANDQLEASVAAGENQDGQRMADCEAEWRKKFSANELEWKQKLTAAETEFMKRLTDKDQEVKLLQSEISSLQSEAEQGEGPNANDAEWRKRLIAVETEWMQKLTEKDNEIKKLVLKLACLESVSSSTGVANIGVGGNSEEDLQKTIDTLRMEMDELERDCKELTDENIELFQKLNRANKEVELKTQSTVELEGSLEGLPRSSFQDEVPGAMRSAEHSFSKQMTEKQVLLEDLELPIKEQGKKIALLEQQLQQSTGENEALRKEIEEKSREIVHRRMELLGAEERAARAEKYSASVSEELEANKSNDDLAWIVSDQEEQLKNFRKKSSRLEEECADSLRRLSLLDAENARLKGQLTQVSELKEKMEDMGHEMQRQKEELELQLQDLALENTETRAEISKRDAEIAQTHQDLASRAANEKNLEAELAERSAEIGKLIQELADRVASEKKLEVQVLELEKERALLDSKLQDLVEERGLSKSLIEELEFQLPVLSEEIKLLNASKHENESIVSNLEIEKMDMQEKLEAAQEESRAAREGLDALEGQLAALTTTLDSQLVAKRNLERRASELESDKEELETQVAELEEENLQLSERTSGLEAQLRYVTEERESYKLEKENAWARSLDLQTEKSRLEATFQEVVSEHQQKLAELEQERLIALQEADNNFQTRQSLGRELDRMREEISTCNHSKSELEKAAMEHRHVRALLEQQLQEAIRECSSSKAKITSLEAEVANLQRDGSQREQDWKAEIESLISLKDEHEHRANKTEEALTRVQSEKAVAVDRLQNELQRLTEQVSSTFDEKEKMASGALVEASELRAEKMELDNSLRHMQEKAKKIEEEAASLQEKLESKIEDMTAEVDASKKLRKDMEQRLQATQTRLEQMLTTAADDKLKIQELEGLVLELEHERQMLLKENTSLNSQATELIGVRAEMEDMRNTIDEIKSEKVAVESSLENVTVRCASLQEEKLAVVEKLTALEAMASEVDELKRNKAALEEKLVRFQSLLEAQEAASIQEAEQRNELIRLRRQVSQFQRKVTKQEEEKDEFMRRVQSLEEELVLKVDALSRTEKQLKERESVGSGRSMDRSNSKVGLSSPSRDTKEVTELRERLRFLEVEVKAREEELDTCKREFREREADLCNRIEHLELSNEQLAVGQVDSGAHQLQRELIRLQNQNSFLLRREQELKSTLNTQEVLRGEVQRLQEANDQLESRFSKFIETVKNPNLLEKIVTLETELAEAIEANNMYKSQLRSVFAKQQNVSMAALQNFGDLDQVINDLSEYKKKATQLEDELRDMHERYSLISLQLAEAEADRGELIITVKNLKNIRKT